MIVSRSANRDFPLVMARQPIIKDHNRYVCIKKDFKKYFVSFTLLKEEKNYNYRAVNRKIRVIFIISVIVL